MMLEQHTDSLPCVTHKALHHHKEQSDNKLGALLRRVHKLLPLYMGVLLRMGTQNPSKVGVGVGLRYIIMRFPIYIGVNLCRGT